MHPYDSSEGQAWFDQHKRWRSPAVTEGSFEEFTDRWPKKVLNTSYGSPEPIGPILPRIPVEDDDV